MSAARAKARASTPTLTVVKSALRLVANPGERVGDEHPYARELDASLREADVPVVLYRVP